MITSSERLADATERTRQRWKARSKNQASADRSNLDHLFAALRIVEQDHQLVVEKAQALRSALAYLRETGDRQAPQVIGNLRRLNEFFESHLAAHMEDEERTLYPLLENSMVEGSALVDQLTAEHTAIVTKYREFADCLQIAAEVGEDGLAHSVVLDLLAFGLDLWEALDAHARTETQAIRQCLVSALPQ